MREIGNPWGENCDINSIFTGSFCIALYISFCILTGQFESSDAHGMPNFVEIKIWSCINDTNGDIAKVNPLIKEGNW